MDFLGEQNIPLLNTHIGNAPRSSDSWLINKKIKIFHFHKENILYSIYKRKKKLLEAPQKNQIHHRSNIPTRH
jgi:hypothetical protein